MIEQGRQIASHVLEAFRLDIEVRARTVRHCRHRPRHRDRGASRELRSGINLPEGLTTLDVSHVSDGPGAATYPNGCHVCEVELDPDTGVIEVVKYSSVNDFGTVINPPIVEGSCTAGVIETGADGDDRLRRRRPASTGSFMDHALPRGSARRSA